MKKIVSSIVAIFALTTAANADFARVELGVGGWNQKPTGTIKYTDGSTTGLYTSEEKEQTAAYAWMLIKHPIPIIPNLRLEYASVEDEGKVDGSFEDFTTTGVTTGSFELNQYDAIAYYNILDNTGWITVDLGVDLKVLDGSFKADEVNILGVGTGNYSDDVSLAVPMGYARVRVEIPATNIGLETDVKYITYQGSTLSDVRIKVDYTLDFIPVVQPALEVGYRAQDYELETDDDKTKSDLKFSGVYAGLMLRF